MRTYRYLMVAAAFILVIILAGWSAKDIDSHDENWQAYTFEIISPIRVKSDLNIADRSGFYKKSFETYGVSDVKRAVLQEYYEGSPLPLVANSPYGYRIFRQDADDLIFLELRTDNIADSEEKGGIAFITSNQSYRTYEDTIIGPDVDDNAGFLAHRMDRVTGRSWVVPFSLPVKPIDDKGSFLIPDAVSIGFEIDYFRIADDIKMLGGGNLHFPSIIGRDQAGWISPESGFLRFEWKWGGETGN